MTKSELMDILDAAREAHKIIQAQVEHIDSLDGQIKKITPSYSGMPGGGGEQDKMAELMAMKMDVMHDSLAVVMRALEAQKRAETLIYHLQGKYLEVLSRRYLDGNEWNAVAAKMNYSKQQLHNIHNQAVEKILKRLDGI